MKLAVVSDIHGNLPALQAVAAEIDAERVDAVVNLGDIVSGPLWPRETAEVLMARGWPTIAGNHERQTLALHAGSSPDDAFTAAELTAAQRAWLAALPADLALDEGRVQAFHARPGDDLRGLLETVTPDFGAQGSPGIRAATDDEMRARLPTGFAPRAQVLLCGHTHVPRAVALDGRLLLNPGSVGRPAYDHDHPHAHVVETGSPHARWALLCRTAAGWQAQLRLTAYDWERAAQRAASLGFAAWARQLRTGRA
jgi:predicted phosphodiesterase